MRRNSLAFRLVAGAAVWCALWLSAGGYALSVLFGKTVERNFDARLGVLIEGLVAGSELNPDGKLELRLKVGEPRFEQPLSGWYWQIADGAQVLRRSFSLWDRRCPPRLLRGSSRPARYVASAARRRAAAASGPRDHAARSGCAPAVRGRGRPARDPAGPAELQPPALARAWRAVHRRPRGGPGPGPLRPGAAAPHGRALGAIRGGATARLESDFPAEIEPLATELNALLDHNEALVERARTHVGNLAHGLKTPLSVLINEARGSDGPLAELVSRQVALMRRQVDHHLARARAIATGSILGARTDVLPVLRDLERTLGRIYAEKALAIEVGARPSWRFAAPARTWRRCSAT